MGFVRLWKGDLLAEVELTFEESAPPVTRHVLWGGSFSPAPTNHGTRTKEEEARYLEARIGRKFDLTRHYFQGPSASWVGNGPLKETVASGRIPVFSITSGGASWASVKRGDQDAAWRARFTELRDAGKTNPFWRGAIWGFENEPEAEVGAKGTPAEYRAAYDYLVGIADSVGLPNLNSTFLMEYSWQKGSGRDPEAWIPATADILGAHPYGYRLGQCGILGFRSFLSACDGPHATAVKLGKRMGAWETGQHDDFVTPDPQRKANWCLDIEKDLLELPRLDYISWWDSGGGDGPNPGSCDWKHSIRTTSTTAALAGYAKVGLRPILLGR